MKSQAARYLDHRSSTLPLQHATAHELSSEMGGSASANDDRSAASPHTVNPLWMITVAGAVTFILLLLIAS